MTFTAIPENYASLYGPLVYAFGDTAEPRTLDIAVENASNGETIAVKRLSNTSSGEVDIAPLIRNRVSVRPVTVAGFSPASLRIPWVRIRVEEAVDTKRFLPALRLPETGAVRLGSMPADRIISWGECDELTLLAGVARAELSAQTAAGSVARVVTNPLPTIPVLFRVDTMVWDESVSQAEVRLLDTNDEELAAVRYCFVPRPAEGVRVAWFGRGGAIEHYTFPVRTEVAERQSRQSLRMAGGEERTFGADFEERTTVVSAHEPQEVLRALAELGTARFAWAVDRSGRYVPVTAEAGEPVLLRRGGPSALRFTLCPTQKNRSLWS